MGKYGPLRNLIFVGGNAINLSQLVPHADLIILQNVLLDLNGKDTELMFKLLRGDWSEQKWAELVSRFDQAEQQSFKEFLTVAKPGQIVKFGNPEQDGKFGKMLVDRLRADPAKIHYKELLNDNTRDACEAYIIDNS